MSSLSPRPPEHGRAIQAVSARGSELAVAAAVWFGLHELAHLRLKPAEWAGLLAGWFACWGLVAGVRALRPAWGGFCRVLEWLGPGLGWVFVNARLSQPLTVGQQIYATVAVGGAAVAWRAWVNWRVRRGADPISEPWRVQLVALAPLWALWPFLSDRLLGGTDARWYALMLGDFIEQLRAGIFPVFIGQGEYAWNGGVHPFRSAPVYMHIAAVWDFLTVRALNAPALQHLVALTAGLAGALGFYAGAAALLPERRWVAAGFAMLYAVAPIYLGVLYCADAYMTFVAMAALPGVMYGNARSLLAEDGRGYGWLAAGLALVWMSHPPTALLSTLMTVLLQGGSLLFGRAPAARWRGAAGGAFLFAGMAAAFFAGMRELPRSPGPGAEDALQLSGLMLALAGLGNGVLRERSRWWLLAVPAGAWLAGLGRAPWAWWIVATSVAVVVMAGLWRWWGRGAKPGEHACMMLWCALVVGAAAAQAWFGETHAHKNIGPLEILKANHARVAEFFLPVRANLSSEGNFQPGTGLWAVLALLAWASARAGALAPKLFFVAASLPLFGIVRVPWVSDFLVGFSPGGIGKVANFVLPIRTLPVMAALLAMGGVVWVAGGGADRLNRFGRWIGSVALVAAVGWGLWQAYPFIARGRAVTETRTRSEDKFRRENAVLDRFAYDLLPHPEYLSHGQMDPWLQARVLDPAGKVVIGPDETARLMEGHGAKRVRLTATRAVNGVDWLVLAPDLVVAPGERQLVRFEFRPEPNYAGWMIWTAPHGYREYHLPRSGLDFAFGTEAKNSRVISLGNSTDAPAAYHLTFLREPGNTLKGDGELFAEAVISNYDPARAAVRVDTLMPSYRVTATVPEGAGWIETSRVFLPGYRATLDGKPVELRRSNQGLAMVAVEPGRREVELRYVGTPTLWAAMIVSGLTWLGWLGWHLRAWRREPAATVEAS